MLKQRIQDDMKTAMKAGDKRRLGTLRLIMAAIKQREVDGRAELDERGIVSVLDKMLKQRRDSIEHYMRANRDDLAEQERYEISVCQEYLPEPLTEEDVAALIDTALAVTGACSVKEMGKVMEEIRPAVQGRADMGVVSRLVKERLAV
jgi:uncharacterized protein YqeY